MNSTATISSITTTCQGNLLSETQFETSDELMLEELERRDGIYSFIFHELESPKATKNSEPEITQSHSPSCNGRRNSLSTKAYLEKSELLSQQSKVKATTKATVATLTTTTKTISSLTNVSGEINVTTSSTPIVTSTTKESITKLPTRNELFRYQQYLKTWYPPLPPPTAVSTCQVNFMKTSASIGSSSSFYLDKRQTNLYVCMMNCGVSVRPQPPRFSHITEPLVRNRRHALKETDGYKQQSNLHALKTPDLRALFPYDPDVHAPFLTRRSTSVDCLKAESEIKSDENKLLSTCSEIK